MDIWKLSTKASIKELGSRPEGLTEQEAVLRLKQHGPNKLIEKKVTSPLKIFLRQFKSLLIIILLVAALISIAIGKISDAGIILFILFVNAVFGFAQEWKAERAMAALKEIAAPYMQVVLREGKTVKIPAEQIVPGDMILLNQGDRVSADARLIEVANLKLDESVLSGESFPVEKTTKILGDAPLAERANMVFSGTTVSYGRAKALVSATGMRTEIGSITKLIEKEAPTPLQAKLDEFGKAIALAILFICAIIFFIGLAHAELVDMLFTSIALAVAAVPEGLPAVVTICLAVGMQRMADRNALVRKLSAVETLGCTTVICSDKTGTLTKGELTVTKIYTDKIIDVSGSGYEPKGKFYKNGKEIVPDKHLNLLLRAGCLCNDAKLERTIKGWNIIGDPTEGCLLVAGEKAGLIKARLDAEYKRVAETPFSSARKRMSTMHRIDKNYILYTKGAPEVLLGLCTKIYKNGSARPFGKAEKQKISNIVQNLAKDGLRVLAIAYKPEKEKKAVEKNLTFLGFVGAIDPPRPETAGAIKLCKRAGMDVVIITGDHPLTAEAVAQQIGIKSKVITGQELEKMNDEQLASALEKIKIYARISPEHKVRIVGALKEKGHIIAVTGDGVNDAPALKKADIGIAMGIRGTDVTKETASIVLGDDNFSTIVAAVEEGRGIYDNIKKFIKFLIATNFGEIFIISLAVIAGLPFLPLLPVQILWINLISDGPPALALSLDPKESGIMKRKPRDPKKGIINGMLFFIAAAGALCCLVTIGAFALEIMSGASIAKAQTMAFTTIVLFELIFIFNCRSEKHSIFKSKPFSNKYLILAVLLSIAAQIAVIYIPFMQALFGTVALGIKEWAIAGIFASSGLLLSPKRFLA